jgi:lipooligosaccharide transport system permease protein
MHVQKTWEAIVNAPMTLEDVLAGEWFWAATKALAAGICMLAIVAAAGYASFPLALAAVPVVVLIGLAFAALGLSVNALASGYDFFSYYMTLLLTPMMMLSGVFFPVERLPETVQAVSRALPLYHGVELARPLLAGSLPPHGLLHAGVLLAYALAGFYLAMVLTRRRLLT